MEEIRHHDRHLDPPEEPTHWECDRCGDMYDGGDLNQRGDKWYCDECLEIIEEEEEDEEEDIE